MYGRRHAELPKPNIEYVTKTTTACETKTLFNSIPPTRGFPLTDTIIYIVL